MQIRLAGTEARNRPIRHKMVILGPFTTDNFYRFWIEVVSWNPAGHCTKMMALRKYDGLYAMALYANPKFRRIMSRAAKRFIDGPMVDIAGDFEMTFQSSSPRLRKWVEGYDAESAHQFTQAFDYMAKKRKAADWPKVNYPRPGEHIHEKLTNVHQFMVQYLEGFAYVGDSIRHAEVGEPVCSKGQRKRRIRGHARDRPRI